MLIGYSPREISVIASREELIDLSTRLRTVGGQIVSDHQMGSPAPYDRFLAGILVEDAPGQSVIFNVTKDNFLRVAGDRRKMEVLAKNVESFAKESDDDQHSHEEYFPGHFYLAPESLPVVFEFSSSAVNQKFSSLQ
jgi:hypothetical protein